MSIDIRNVKDVNGLITYFAEKLDWNIDLDDFEDIEDITYDFDASDIGLKDEEFAKIQSLRQLPPLVDGQKWGIFCVEFDSKKFEVTALRKILSGLVPKRRNAADHAVWNQKDLLFICFWGSDNDRTIGIAHFEDVESGLPQIKMISCAPATEDAIQIRVFESRLSKLAWPKDTADTDGWRSTWADAFVTGYRQVVQDASTLTVKLAEEAQGIRNRILDIFKVESPNGYVHLLFDKFRNTLIHDMTEQQFADMYAQTVVYGLFSARCMDSSQENFSADEAINCIPNTNPFLKSLMKECIGTENNSKLSFDELEIENVVELLRKTKTEAIIADFNRQTGGGREDPVIHFYEEFLTAYDKVQKVQRGVYYTPQPVVNFIVRAVDSILKDEFGLEDGLASTNMKKVKYMRDSVRKKTLFVEDTKDDYSIQVLDPATGTGTFIRQTILQIYDNFKSKRKEMSDEQMHNEWNEYVPKSLLPRLNAFELMMAPYAVAHMKLAMVLKDTGYDFKSESRLRVYLTNALEEPGNSTLQLSLFEDALAKESISANEVKKNSAINIVIGNPPYAASSANKNQWIEEMISSYKTEPGGKEKLKEQKYSIDADEIKFIRYGQYIVDRCGSGILAYINPHAYLDKPTYRGMRWQLLNEFDRIYIVNLHGNGNHQEKNPNGGKDENVFDILQGVCINIFAKKSRRTKKLAEVYYTDLFGERYEKYVWMNKNNISDIHFEKLDPCEPHFMFVPTGQSGNYYNGFSLEKLLTVHLEGIQTGKDKLVLQKNKESLDTVISDFLKLDAEIAREKYNLGSDGRDWRVQWAQDDLKNHYPNQGKYFKVALRPFDIRWSFYTGVSSGFIKCCRGKVTEQIVGHDNIALILTRNAMPQKPYSNFMIVNTCVVGRYIGDFSTSSQVFPIFSYSKSFDDEKKTANFNGEIITKLCDSLHATYNECDDKCSENSFDAYDLVYYIYAVLNSWKYRTKYKEPLCREFPYVPYPKSIKYLKEMAKLGKELATDHINYQLPKTPTVPFEGEGNNMVSCVKWNNEKVFINKTQFFANVQEDVWNYWIGGHQIAQKWIKERKGEVLSESDVANYCNIVGIINETIKVITPMGV